MQTPTHLLTTALLNRIVPKGRIRPHTASVLIGAVLPDIPFTLLTLIYEAYYRWFAELPKNPYGSVMEYLHFDLFFNDPIWIIGHNTLHSLVVSGSLLVIGYLALRAGRRWGVYLFWLAAAMLLHTLLDIVTHTSDGPLIFFPLNWTFRFASPVSYWEEGSFGRFFVIAEYVVDALILAYFLVRWRSNRQNAPS